MNQEQFINTILTEHQNCRQCPKPKDVSQFFKRVLGLLFKDYSHIILDTKEKINQNLEILRKQLTNIVSNSPIDESARRQDIIDNFFNSLPQVYQLLINDIEAIYNGDPASYSRYEVIRSYPGFYAIAAYRLANILHVNGLKEIPRIITEYAHSKTGIDIHPGASIGKHFCIDHGTGVVIGETTEIGDNVKIYQGVTLGALSVKKENANQKRHPTIEDYSVIYAGATILGGNTIIGHHSVVGGNVWLTKSIDPYSKIYYQSKMHNGEDYIDTVVFKNFEL